MFYYIQEDVDDNSIQLVYTPTDQLAADLLTMSLPQMEEEQHHKQLLGQMQTLPTICELFCVGVLRKKHSEYSGATKLESL